MGPEVADMVNQVRKARDEQTPEKKGKTDQDFGTAIKQLFGKDLNLPDMKPPSPDLELNEVGDLLDRMESYQDSQEAMKETTKLNFAHWTDVDLE